MSTPGRLKQRLYTIDGEPGWTTQEVAIRVCVPGSGLTYNLVSKRLQRGEDTWELLSRPSGNVAARSRPADPRARPKPLTLSDVARQHAEQIQSERRALWLSWRGPVSAGQLVARIGA